MASRIRKERFRAGLSQSEVARALGRSQVWVSLAERNKAPISRDLESHVLKTIARLAAFKESVGETKARLVDDLALPGTYLRVR